MVEPWPSTPSGDRGVALGLLRREKELANSLRSVISGLSRPGHCIGTTLYPRRPF
jgi:hypothetical protein